MVEWRLETPQKVGFSSWRENEKRRDCYAPLIQQPPPRGCSKVLKSLTKSIIIQNYFVSLHRQTQIKMKQHTITLTGRGIIIGTINNPEDQGNLIEYAMILEDVKVVLDDEIDITKQKGKYIKDKSWIKDHCLLTEEPPYYFRIMEDTFDFEYNFDLDVEDFDPKKLQLIKSDYELEFLPYGIVTDAIMYDGEPIWTREEDLETNLEYGFTSYRIEQVDKMPFA